MGEPYLIEARGFCMGEGMPHGSRYWADPDAPITPGQLVRVELSLSSLWGPWLLEANADYGVPETFICGMGKIFLRRHHSPRLGELIYLGCISPPNIGIFRRTDIVKMHAVVAIEGGPPTMSEDDKLGYSLITTLCDKEAMEPINPQALPVVSLGAVSDKLAAIAEPAALKADAA